MFYESKFKNLFQLEEIFFHHYVLCKLQHPTLNNRPINLSVSPEKIYYLIFFLIWKKKPVKLTQIFDDFYVFVYFT